MGNQMLDIPTVGETSSTNNNGNNNQSNNKIPTRNIIMAVLVVIIVSCIVVFLISLLNKEDKKESNNTTTSTVSTTNNENNTTTKQVEEKLKRDLVRDKGYSLKDYKVHSLEEYIDTTDKNLLLVPEYDIIEKCDKRSTGTFERDGHKYSYLCTKVDDDDTYYDMKNAYDITVSIDDYFKIELGNYYAFCGDSCHSYYLYNNNLIDLADGKRLLFNVSLQNKVTKKTISIERFWGDEPEQFEPDLKTICADDSGCEWLNPYIDNGFLYIIEYIDKSDIGSDKYCSFNKYNLSNDDLSKEVLYEFRCKE